MARGDGAEKRALAQVRKGVERGDARLATAGLLELAPEARSGPLAAVAGLFRKDVARAHAAADWSRLAFWAARGEHEPRLTSEGANVLEAQGAHWALLWGCAWCRDWSRARRWFQALHPGLSVASPALARALEAWLTSEGQVPPEALEGLEPRAPGEDPRLGHEPRRAHCPAPAPPAEGEEVEPAVFALCATEPWSVFASTVEGWASRLPAGPAMRVWRLAGRLAMREQLRRRAAGERGEHEPAELLAHAALALGPSPELSGELLLSLRLMVGTAGARKLERREDVRAFTAVARQAALQAEHRRVVLGAMAGIGAQGPTAELLLGLVQDLLRVEPSASLWAKALELWDRSAPSGFPAPEWLQGALDGLRRDGNPLAIWLRHASPAEGELLLDRMQRFLSPRRVEEWVDRCWDGADEQLKGRLADSILGLMVEMAQGTDRVLKPGGPYAGRVTQVLHQREEVLRLWGRFEGRMLPYHPAFLDLALALAPTEEAARAAVDRFVLHRPGVVNRLEAMRSADLAGREQLAQRIKTEALEAFRDNLEALARGLEWTLSEGAPPEVMEAFARALAEADARNPGERSLKLQMELDLARRLLPRRRGNRKATRAPSKKKKTRKAPPSQKPLVEEKP